MEWSKVSHASLIVALPPDTEDIDATVEEAMAPYNEAGHCFADGTRWDWWVIGGRFSGKFGPGVDITRRGDLDVKALEAYAENKAREVWRHYQDGACIFPVPQTETKDEYIARRRANILGAYAFLKDHVWYETERLGWFGWSAAGESGGGEYTCPETGAKIITTNETHEEWDANFWPRFIRDLPPDTVLVCVDYHV